MANDKAKRKARLAPPSSLRSTIVYPDQSYLAYLRPTPRPFLRFTSGHFPPDTVTVPHSHPCIAVHGCLQGPLTLITTAGEAVLDSGVFYALAPGVVHHWRNDHTQTAATLGLLVDGTQPGRWPAGTGVESCCKKLESLVTSVHRFSTAGDRELNNVFWLAADHLTAEEPREPAVIAGALLVLLGQMCERLDRTSRSVLTHSDVAQQIRRLLLARVQERLSIGKIAREVCVSPTAAKQSFRAAFGCGIMTYFNQLKIWQAKRLLSDPTLTIQEISHQLGFANAGYFSRVFALHTGEPPITFRQRAMSTQE